MLGDDLPSNSVSFHSVVCTVNMIRKVVIKLRLEQALLVTKSYCIPVGCIKKTCFSQHYNLISISHFHQRLMIQNMIVLVCRSVKNFLYL